MTKRGPVRPPVGQPSVDLRRHRRKTERDLVIGGFLILLVVGGGLVWYLYGPAAALASWICLGAGGILLGSIVLLLRLMEIWSNPPDGE